MIGPDWLMVAAQSLVAAMIVLLALASIHKDAGKMSLARNLVETMISLAVIGGVLWAAGAFDRLIPR